jgi:hypothetical protein
MSIHGADALYQRLSRTPSMLLTARLSRHISAHSLPADREALLSAVGVSTARACGDVASSTYFTWRSSSPSLSTGGPSPCSEVLLLIQSAASERLSSIPDCLHTGSRDHTRGGGADTSPSTHRTIQPPSGPFRHFGPGLEQTSPTDRLFLLEHRRTSCPPIRAPGPPCVYVSWRRLRTMHGHTSRFICAMRTAMVHVPRHTRYRTRSTSAGQPQRP